MKKGTLYTSYYANIKNGIGVKIAVSACVPRWLKSQDLHWRLRHIAPPGKLLISYKKGDMEFENFMVTYQKYINSNDVNVNQDISYLMNLLNMGKDVTIYCYEKDHLNCHRNIIGNKMKSLGYKVREI